MIPILQQVSIMVTQVSMGNSTLVMHFRDTNPDNTVIFFITILGDRTVVDGAMRKSIELYSFTLRIFQQHAHAKPSTWHGLCYVKNNTLCLFSPEKIRKDNALWAANFVSNKNPAMVNLI